MFNYSYPECLFFPPFYGFLKIKIILPVTFHINKRSFITQSTNNLTRILNRSAKVNVLSEFPTRAILKYCSATAISGETSGLKTAVSEGNWILLFTHNLTLGTSQTPFWIIFFFYHFARIQMLPLKGPYTRTHHSVCAGNFF